MYRILLWVSLAVCGLLGIVHTAVTIPTYGALSADAVWFTGTGLGLILLALLNFTTWSAPHPSRTVRRLTHAANLVMTMFGIVAVRAVPEPQAYLVLASIIGLLAAGAGVDRTTDSARRSGSPAT